MALPTEKDLQSEVRGDIDKYYQAKNTSAEEKILGCSDLRGTLPEAPSDQDRNFTSDFSSEDPVRMAGNLYNWYDKEPYKERIRNFLHRERLRMVND